MLNKNRYSINPYQNPNSHIRTRVNPNKFKQTLRLFKSSYIYNRKQYPGNGSVYFLSSDDIRKSFDMIRVY